MPLFRLQDNVLPFGDVRELPSKLPSIQTLVDGNGCRWMTSTFGKSNQLQSLFSDKCNLGSQPTTAVRPFVNVVKTSLDTPLGSSGTLLIVLSRLVPRLS